jgi:hypothetical protein
MAYKATVVPVMIASPGDVAEEREIARSVIHDWNDVNSQRSKVMLAAVGWDTHSSPELGERPQELINKRILKDCDILVGVFWTRLGTPTGKSPSGTVEEIEEHVAAGKPAMIYFSSRPVEPDSVDLEQYKQVKEILKKWQQQGLIETYDNVEQFRQKLSKQLQLNKNEYLRNILESPNTDSSTSNVSPVPEVTPAFPEKPKFDLSKEEAALLKAAASDENGVIMRMEYVGGQQIQAGKDTFGEENRREFSRWDGALRNLQSKGLVVGRGYKGEIFELTHEGWSVADAL